MPLLKYPFLRAHGLNQCLRRRRGGYIATTGAAAERGSTTTAATNYRGGSSCLHGTDRCVDSTKCAALHRAWEEFPRLEVSCAPTTTMTTNRHVHHQHHYPNCSDEVFVPPPALPAFVCGSGWRKGGCDRLVAALASTSAVVVAAVRGSPVALWYPLEDNGRGAPLCRQRKLLNYRARRCASPPVTMDNAGALFYSAPPLLTTSAW
jgi:hypothetical protein